MSAAIIRNGVGTPATKALQREESMARFWMTGGWAAASCILWVVAMCGGAAAEATGWAVSPARPGDPVTTVILGNPGQAALRDAPATLGHLFRPGELPAGRGLTARLKGGGAVPLQVDAKATHRDGSLRHAVLTARVPTLAAGAEAVVELVAAGAAAPAGEAVKLSDLLATEYDAKVAITIDGEAYTASAREALAAAAKNKTLVTWLEGPLVGEWGAAMLVRKADGTEHPHLCARFDVRCYAGGKLARTDVCIENCWAFEPSPSGFTYDVVITADGKTAYEKQGLAHSHHARWHKQVWHGADPGLTIKHDTPYMIDTRAVPNYDLSIKVSPKVLDSMPAEYGPMECGGLTSAMPNTGAHSDIGPLPLSAAVYVMTQDPRARANTLANGAAGGAYHIHYRDKVTDLPASIEEHAGMTILGDSARNPKTKKSDAFPKVEKPRLQRHQPDDAHQPSIAFLPYVISGDRFQLEELLFWANYNMLSMNCAYRKYDQGVFGFGQVRAIAWNMRTLAHAAYITPDAHPMKRYFVEKLMNNIAMFNEAFPQDVECKGKASPLGVLNWSNQSGFARPWMDDFCTWTFGYLVDLGYPEATPMALYKAKFVVGRMTPPFSWQHAPMYTSKDKDKDGKVVTSFDEYYKANFEEPATGLKMDGFPDSPYGYGANMQPALAMAVDRGAPGAREAWERYETRDPKQNYGSSPVWAVVPRKNTGGAVPSTTGARNGGRK